MPIIPPTMFSMKFHGKKPIELKIVRIAPKMPINKYTSVVSEDACIEVFAIFFWGGGSEGSSYSFGLIGSLYSVDGCVYFLFVKINMV